MTIMFDCITLLQLKAELERIVDIEPKQMLAKFQSLKPKRMKVIKVSQQRQIRNLLLAMEGCDSMDDDNGN